MLAWTRKFYLYKYSTRLPKYDSWSLHGPWELLFFAPKLFKYATSTYKYGQVERCFADDVIFWSRQRPSRYTRPPNTCIGVCSCIMSSVTRSLVCRVFLEIWTEGWDGKLDEDSDELVVVVAISIAPVDGDDGTRDSDANAHKSEKLVSLSACIVEYPIESAWRSRLLAELYSSLPKMFGLVSGSWKFSRRRLFLYAWEVA